MVGEYIARMWVNKFCLPKMDDSFNLRDHTDADFSSRKKNWALRVHPSLPLSRKPLQAHECRWALFTRKNFSHPTQIYFWLGPFQSHTQKFSTFNTWFSPSLRRECSLSKKKPLLGRIRGFFMKKNRDFGKKNVHGLTPKPKKKLIFQIYFTTSSHSKSESRFCHIL